LLGGFGCGLANKPLGELVGVGWAFSFSDCHVNMMARPRC
jgi:hypothetical protein